MKAEEVIRAYYLAQATCLSNPQKSGLTCFDGVAIGSALSDSRNTLISAKTMKTSAKGNIKVVSVQRTKVDLTKDQSQTPPVVPTVAFRVCVDVSGFNIVDEEGRSIVPPDRKPRSAGSIAVANYEYPDATQWRVAYIMADGNATC